MSEQPRELSLTLPLLSEKTPLSSDDMIDEEVIERKIELDGKEVKLKAVTHKGGPNKKFNEDGCSVIADSSNLQIFVIDGGTQLEQVKSLGDLSGGEHIKRQVIKFSKQLDPSVTSSDNLRILNQLVRDENSKSHPDIVYTPDSRNIPYGSIAGVKVDTKNKRIEISNAGNVFVVVIKADGEPELVSLDDVREFD